MKIKLYRPVLKSFPISSPFGWREKPSPKFHNGIDFAVPVGTDILSMCSGHIIRAGWENDSDKSAGFGLRIMQQTVIDDQIYFVWYGHLSKIFLSPGEVIKAGQLIGLSGNTGRSTGPHLHVQVRKKDTSQYFDMEWADEGDA